MFSSQYGAQLGVSVGPGLAEVLLDPVGYGIPEALCPYPGMPCTDVGVDEGFMV